MPSWRWQASYIGPDGCRHSAPTTFSDEITAEGWLVDERRLIEREQWTSPAQCKTERKAEQQTTRIILEQYAETWIAQRDIKERTRVHYRAVLDKHLGSLGKVAVSDLKPDAIRAWYASFNVTKPRIRSHAYGLLHAILTTAVSEDKILPSNPCQMKKAMHTTRKTVPKVLTVDEVARLADGIEPQRFRALVSWCGLRWGEVTELRRSDISAGAETIIVERGVTHRKTCSVDPPKSGAGRIVVVPPHIRADIEEHLANHVGEKPNSLLFPPTRGRCHLNDQAFREQSWDAALAKIGRQGVRFHDLRHFAGTMASRVGSLVETMARLGHSTVDASLLYQQMVSGRDREVAEALSRLATTTSDAA